MLFKQRFLDGIRNGTITVAFRRWRRPSVRAGGTLLTPIGALGISSVSEIEAGEITERDTRSAGYESREALLADLNRYAGGRLYRIDLGSLRADPRIALRESLPLAADDRATLVDRLKRLDARAPGGPWTRRTLALIATHPETRAADLCRLLGQDKEPFKLNVRKLKTLGLTESLPVGYRLSPRGTALLRSFQE